MSFLAFLTFVSALSNVAQAGHEVDVSYALDVLNELPAELASPYCSSYAGGGAAKTWTVTAAPYTVTTTLEPTPCGKTGGYTAAPWGGKTKSYGQEYPATKLGGFDYPAPSYEDSEDYYPEPTEEAYPGAPHEVTDIEGEYPTPSDEYYPDVTDAPQPGDGNYPGEGGEPGEGEPDVFVTSTTTLTYTLTSTRTSTIYPGSTDALVVDPTGFIWPEPTDVYIDPLNSDPTYANPTDAFYLDPIYAEPTDDVYIDPLYADPTGDIYSEPTFIPLKRSAKFLFSRAEWCEDIGRPCRLMVYTDAEISDACGKYLGSEGGYKVDAVTVTETVYGETATATVTLDACVTGDYAEYTDAPEYGSDSKPEEGYGGEEEGDESYESPSYGEEEPSTTYEDSYGAPEETGAPWGEEGASYGDHSLEHSDSASYGEATPTYEGYPVTSETSYPSYGDESAPHGEDDASYGEGKPAEGDYESNEGGEDAGAHEGGKPEYEGSEHGGPPAEGKPEYEGSEHGGPPAEGKPEYGGGEHGGPPEGKPEYGGGEHGGPPAEGKPEHGEEEPKPKPKMCKVKTWKK